MTTQPGLLHEERNKIGRRRHHEAAAYPDDLLLTVADIGRRNVGQTLPKTN